MRILVLDTIHGGAVIAHALRDRGHSVDMVDVYRGKAGISPDEAEHRTYDLAIAPVHLDPAYPLLHGIGSPVLSHHQVVKWILGHEVPRPFIEITGARGKTTTAHALAHVMEGPGILHTSTGTIEYPAGVRYSNPGITPASLIGAVTLAKKIGGWVIAEISLGFSGLGQLGILTSTETYPFAAKQKDALKEKMRSGRSLPAIILPPGMHREGSGIPANEIVHTDGLTCRFGWGDLEGEFCTPLLVNEAYRTPLILAAAAACVLGIDPTTLATFSPLEGRLAVSRIGNTVVVDDSNSGTCAATARQAIQLARQESGCRGPLTLVIGKEDGAICEGFPAGDILAVVREENPERVILVGKDYESGIPDIIRQTIRVSCCNSLAEGKASALEDTACGMVVLAVKTWR